MSWLDEVLAAIQPAPPVGPQPYRDPIPAGAVTSAPLPWYPAGSDPMTAGAGTPFGLGGDPMTAGGPVPNGPGGDMAAAQLANRIRAGNPAMSFPTSQPTEKYTDYASGWPQEMTRPVAQFGDIPAALAAPPQMAAQSPLPGLNSPMGGGGAPFSIAGLSPSMAAAKAMTAPPPPSPTEQHPAIPGLVAPGSAPGVPPAPAMAPPVVAQGDEETPAAAPTDTSARRRDVPPAVAAGALAQAADEPTFGARLRTAGGGLAAALREASPSMIALGAGLAGEGWDKAATLAAARNKREEDLALQGRQSNATARLLASKGASPQEIAAAVAGGPDVVKALIGQYFGKDKFAVTQTGEIEDAYGGKRKVFKVFNSNDGTFKDVPADTAAEAKAIASGAAPDLNEAQQNRVQAIIDGREPYPAMSRATDAAKIRAAVHAADPNFDAVNYNSRSQTRKNFTSGKAAGNVTAFNTAIGHLGTLYDSIDGLGNRSSPWYNRATQGISENLDTKYAANLKKFEAARTAVADELTRAFRGSGGNVHDIIQWEKTISTADSPQALKAAVQQAAELLNSRIVSLGDEYNRGMGTTKNPMELLNPKAASAFQHLLEGGRSLAVPAAAGQVKVGDKVIPWSVN